MTENINPLLQKSRLPGKIFQLPSAGLFYVNGELSPDVENGEVHVHPMTGIEELYLKNPDMLFSGKGLSIVLKRCVPQILKPDDLLENDVQAIFVFLRMVTYGDEFKIEAAHFLDQTDPDSDLCTEGGKAHSYLVSVESLISRIKYINTEWVNQFGAVVLPTGHLVKFKPLLRRELLALLKKNAGKNQLEHQEIVDNLISHLLAMIDNVDGITDKKMIAEFIESLPPQSLTSLGDSSFTFQKWGVDSTQELVCKDCKSTFTIDLPLDPISFFTP